MDDSYVGEWDQIMFLPFVVSAGLAAFFKNFEALYKMVNVTGAVTQQPRQTIKYTGLYFFF